MGEARWTDRGVEFKGSFPPHLKDEIRRYGSRAKSEAEFMERMRIDYRGSMLTAEVLQ